MVVRHEILRERLAGLRETLRRLAEIHGRQPIDAITEWALERGLQIAAQSVFDIGNHVLTGGFGDRVSDYAAIPVGLCKRGVIRGELEAKLRGLAGFRNLLVHDYVQVDPERVRDLLEQRMGDLAEFADAIEAWMDEA